MLVTFKISLLHIIVFLGDIGFVVKQNARALNQFYFSLT